jgi:hypothetical protein
MSLKIEPYSTFKTDKGDWYIPLKKISKDKFNQLSEKFHEQKKIEDLAEFVVELTEINWGDRTYEEKIQAVISDMLVKNAVQIIKDGLKFNSYFWAA